MGGSGAGADRSTDGTADGTADGAAARSAGSAAGGTRVLAAWVGAASGWIAGSALQLQQPALWARAEVWTVAAVLLSIALGAAWLALRKPSQRAAPVGVLAAAFAAALGLAFAVTSERAAARLADALPAALEGQDLLVTGVVAQLPRPGITGTRFVFEVESALHQGQPVRVPRRLSLGWYRGVDDDALLLGPAAELRAGQRWQFTLRLRQPHGAVNPHGFDLELWLWEQGIRAGGTVRSLPANPARKLAENTGHPVERARQAVREAIERRVADPASAGVLAALAIGDQAAIEREDWDLFRQTGVAHLMSISGLHVTMFAWLAGGLVGWLWRRSERLALAWPAPAAARWGGLAAAVGYALLAGWGVPAQRTLGMIAAVVVLRSAGVRWPLHLVLLVAGAVVVAGDPWALLQPGFWLSFVAVALLVAAEPEARPDTQGVPWHRRALALLRSGLRTQAVATVGLTPLSMLFFQQVSVVGFAANLVAIPLVTLLITPLALLGVLLPPLWPLAGVLVQGLAGFLAALAALPGSLWSAAAAPPWAVAAGLLGGALAVLPLPWRLRLLALPLMLPLLAPPVPRPATGEFELVAADVGQGTAVLLRTRSHLLLYDTGPQYSPEADAGGRVLLPLLRARGERAIDLLMLSHRDSDHVGGAATLLRALPVALLSSSLADGHPLRRPGLPHRPCQAGQRWQWDGVDFEVLHPTAAELAAATRPEARTIKANALSCVLRVQGRQGSALLTGDIEAAQEAALLARDAAALRSDILLVPHHGSRTSSTPAFIDAVAPRVALVQAAYRSRYGHPAPEVVARYSARGITLVRSDRCGAWSAPAAGAPRCERQAARRYWHHPPSAADPAAPVPSPPGAPR